MTTFFSFYKNTVPLNTFFIISGIGGLIGILFTFGLSVFGSAVILAGTAETTKLRVKTILYETFINFNKHLLLKTYRGMILDSIISSCAILTIGALSALFTRILYFYFAHEAIASKPAIYLGSITNSFYGPLTIGATLVLQLVSMPLLVGLLIAICKYLRLTTYWRVLGAGTLINILCTLGFRYWQDFFLGILTGIISLTISWFVITKAFNRNILSVFMLVWLTYTGGLATELWRYGWPTFTTEVIISTVLLALPFFILLYVYVMPNIQNIKIDNQA